ncbi:TPM domain-containing protein [Imbroritus primus]|uniref:TPM domain-containing protein n=1 Tax=Imbroritus primus TaxID=3058603 RepID=UPI003D161D1F
MPAHPSRLKRLCTHLCTTHAHVRALFPDAELDRIEHAIQAGEHGHQGELRVVIEGSLPLAQVWGRVSPRERAEHIFRELDIWDTEANSGVLLYLNIADHAVEIVADRGFAARVPATTWDELCAILTSGFTRQQQTAALHQVIHALHALANRHFPVDPARGGNSNELPDRPLIC